MFRFANRIPLVFEPGADVVSKVAKSIKWGGYQVRQPWCHVCLGSPLDYPVSFSRRGCPCTHQINESTAKLGVFASIVSTHIPFAGASKARDNLRVPHE